MMVDACMHSSGSRSTLVAIRNDTIQNPKWSDQLLSPTLRPICNRKHGRHVQLRLRILSETSWAGIRERSSSMVR